MDQYVYHNESIAKYVNSNFVSVKIQFDSTQKDDEETKKWFAVSKNINSEYGIGVFPSFLFFSPDGVIVHRDAAFKDSASFLNLLNIALDTANGYYSLIRKYQEGDQMYAKLPYLSSLAKTIRNDNEAEKMSQDYIHNYLLRNPEKISIRENMVFFVYNIKDTHDSAFFFLKSHTALFDSVFGRYFARNIMDYLIGKDYVPNYGTNEAPSWDTRQEVIEKDFGEETAERIILAKEVAWYRRKKDWVDYTKLLTKRVNRFSDYGVYGVYFYLNNDAWNIFLHSSNRSELKSALKWCTEAMEDNPKYVNTYDTYANILYVLGRRKKAIFFEERAVSIAPAEKPFQEVLLKMKNGEKITPPEQ